MAMLICEWPLPRDITDLYGITPGARILRGLTKINIFVGANNSGKSRFMRGVFSLDDRALRVWHPELDAVNSNLSDCTREVGECLEKHGIPGGTDGHRGFQIVPLSHIELGGDILAAVPMLSKLVEMKYLGGGMPGDSLPPRERAAAIDLKGIGERHQSAVKRSQLEVSKDAGFHRIYIPILRGLRPPSEEEAGRDLYQQRTEHDYFKESRLTESHTIFTGLGMYEEVKSNLLGDLRQRQRIRDFEQFLGKSFFQDREIALIPRQGDDVLYVKIGKEEERPIHSLGDGIQQLIILTFPLFLRKEEPTILFVEEPEIYLHPGLQRRFLELLTGEELPNVQVFLTTHSNHFLDISLDLDQISIFRFSKELPDSEEPEVVPKFRIENVHHDDTALLDCLGVRNSSVFLANCTIWVEGITDRLYLREYLRLYQEYLAKKKKDESHFREDTHYAFIEYGGSNITHWFSLGSEDRPIRAESISNRFILVADKDEPKRGSAKQKRQKTLLKKLGDGFIRLNRREIENLLSKEVLLAVIREDLPAGTVINERFEYEDYAGESLGRFIDKTVLRGLKSGKTFADKYGAIKRKTDFCKKAISCMDDYQSLSRDARTLCRRLYEFIKKCNQDVTA